MKTVDAGVIIITLKLEPLLGDSFIFPLSNTDGHHTHTHTHTHTHMLAYL